MITENPQLFTPPGGINNELIGANIDITGMVDGTIAPTRLLSTLVGTGSIATITPPWPDFCGPLYLFGSGTTTFTNAGNIGNVSIGSVGTDVFCICVYNRVTGKWYINAGYC